MFGTKESTREQAKREGGRWREDRAKELKQGGGMGSSSIEAAEADRGAGGDYRNNFKDNCVHDLL